MSERQGSFSAIFNVANGTAPNKYRAFHQDVANDAQWYELDFPAFVAAYPDLTAELTRFCYRDRETGAKPDDELTGSREEADRRIRVLLANGHAAVPVPVSVPAATVDPEAATIAAAAEAASTVVVSKIMLSYRRAQLTALITARGKYRDVTVLTSAEQTAAYIKALEDSQQIIIAEMDTLKSLELMYLLKHNQDLPAYDAADAVTTHEEYDSAVETAYQTVLANTLANTYQVTLPIIPDVEDLLDVITYCELKYRENLNIIHHARQWLAGEIVTEHNRMVYAAVLVTGFRKCDDLQKTLIQYHALFKACYGDLPDQFGPYRCATLRTGAELRAAYGRIAKVAEQILAESARLKTAAAVTAAVTAAKLAAAAAVETAQATRAAQEEAFAAAVQAASFALDNALAAGTVKPMPAALLKQLVPSWYLSDYTDNFFDQVSVYTAAGKRQDVNMLIDVAQKYLDIFTRLKATFDSGGDDTMVE